MWQTKMAGPLFFMLHTEEKQVRQSDLWAVSEQFVTADSRILTNVEYV